MSSRRRYREGGGDIEKAAATLCGTHVRTRTCAVAGGGENPRHCCAARVYACRSTVSVVPPPFQDSRHRANTAVTRVCACRCTRVRVSVDRAGRDTLAGHAGGAEGQHTAWRRLSDGCACAYVPSAPERQHAE
jgi:hypothetical protein